MNELLDAAVGKAAKEERPLSVPGQTLERPDLFLAVEEHVHSFAVDADQHRMGAFPGGRGAGWPVDLVDLIGQGSLEGHHLERHGVGHVAPAGG